MLDFEKLDSLYTKAFAMRKKKHWLNLPWDFLIGIKTRHHGMWYGLPVITHDDEAIGFAIYDKAYGLPVVRYMLDEEWMDNSSDYECDSLLNQQNVYYFTFVNKSELKHWQEAEWIQDYCDKHGLKCRGRRCYPLFHHLEPGFYTRDLNSVAEISICETFVKALDELDRMLAAGELAPQQWQCANKIEEKITLPVLLEQANGSWHQGKDTLPPVGTLNWPRLLPNDFDTVRMKRFPKNGSTWQLEKFVHDMNSMTYNVGGQVEKLLREGAGIYVDALIIYDEAMGHIMFMDNFFMRIEGQNAIMSFMTEAMEKDGRPMKIVVGSEESYEFMKVFCQKLDIQLVLDEVPQLVTMRENVLAGRNPVENFDDEEWEPTDPRADWGCTSGYMPDVEDEAIKNHKGKKLKQNSNIVKNDKDMSKLLMLIGDFLHTQLSANAKEKQKAEKTLNAFLDKCTKAHYLAKMDEKMLEVLLNLAMASPMDSKLFRSIVGEYQRRLGTGTAGFLAIVSDEDV